MNKKQQNKEERDSLKQLLNDIRNVASTESGKRVLWHILSTCEIYSDGFTGNSHTFHNAGKRSIGIQLLELMDEADPYIYINLLKERVNARRYTNSGPE